MQNGYYFDNSPVNNFNSLCQDISSRRRFHDVRSFTILVVDQFFNSADTDLCQISFKQVDVGKFDYLIGLNSEVFKCICSDDLLFRNFLHSLIDHCKKSRVSIAAFYQSLYFHYFNDVLAYILPKNDTTLLTLKKMDWFCAINKHSAAKSALRLLKPQVIAASYAPDVFAQTDGFSSLYPRVFEFCNISFQRLIDRTSLLYENQLITLKRFVLHYISFLLAPTSDPDFASFKQRLSSLNWVTKFIKPFLLRRLPNAALDPLYEEIVDFWLSLVSPSDNDINKDRDQLRLFLNDYSKEFVEILFIVMERCRQVDLSLASHVNFVSYVVYQVFAPEMCNYYHTLGIDPDDYLAEIQNKLRLYQQAIEADEREKHKTPVQYKLAQFFGIFQSIVTPSQRFGKELQAILDVLNARLGERDPSAFSTHTSLNASHLTGSTSSISSFNPQFNSTPIRNTPEHRTDPVTKLHYLTSEGRKQVLGRKAQFDFSHCSATLSRISPHAGPWENEYMVNLLQRLSEKYSDSAFTRYLRINNGHTWAATILSKMFLSNPYAHRYVPVYSRNIVDKLPQLNLRFMASYPFLVTFILVIWFLISFLIATIF